MESRKVLHYSLPVQLVIVPLLVAACAERADPGACPTGPTGLTCAACHTSASALQAAAGAAASARYDDVPGHGPGGEVAAREPWERVLVDSTFLATTHGAPGCPACHGGHPGAATKDEAHAGVNADPSSAGAPACAGCHAQEAGLQATSLHATLAGFRTAIAHRAGVAGLDAAMTALFEQGCGDCHGSCGQCHISRPASAGGGLVAGHRVVREPSPEESCGACHGRVAAEFRGELAGHEPDVHRQAGRACTDCHEVSQLHGDGVARDSRHDVTAVPRCLDCHPDAGSEESEISAHAYHHGEVQCHACHAQSYLNCYGCHIGVDERGLAAEPQADFRIGKNARRGVRRPWEHAVLRHVPIAPDSYAAWGVALPAFASAATWVPASPHTIMSGEQARRSCSLCHTDESSLCLSEAFIQAQIQSGLMLEAERQANSAITVSGFEMGRR